MSLKTLRQKIDKVDLNILKLLNERARLTINIGKIKKRQTKPTFSPDREKEIYQKVKAANQHLKALEKSCLDDNALEAVYREIMSSSLALQKATHIAYLGPEATFTHIAALKKFGKLVKYTESDSIADVFVEVERDRADYGVVPIENSTEGAINHTLDMFLDSEELKICSEVYLPIKHNLMSKSKKISSIKKVYSHPQVFAQCRMWLEKNMPRARLIPETSTTWAALLARKYKSAAIASELAAEKYGLNILARSIEDSPHNITRFLIIGKQDVAPTKHDKTSIVFSMKDKAGALHDVLTPFKRNHINLTMIESRPSKKKAWKYYFYVDMEGHIKDKTVKQSLKQLQKYCSYYKFLGSYPVA